MHIAAPKGTAALVNAADGEILLARDTEVAITRVEPDGQGGWDMYGVVLPKVKPKAKKSAPADAQPAKTKAKTTPPAKKAPAVDPEPDPIPAAPTPPDEPAPLSYADRAKAAISGEPALASVRYSLNRRETHAGVGNGGGLSIASRDALFAYQGSDYRRINGQLRDLGTGKEPIDDPDADQWIADIDAAMTGSLLPQDMVTYRGVRNARKMFGDRLDADLTGIQWREDAYLSSSAHQHITDQFARGTDGVRMRILTPAGVGAVQVSGTVDAAGHEDESEILLARGQVMRVVADRGLDADGVRDLDVEVVPV
jgi:hypothetical protein